MDHDDATELSEFQQLAGQVFAVAGAGEQQSQHKLRTNLYDDLVKYFPPEMTQPAGEQLTKMRSRQNKLSEQKDCRHRQLVTPAFLSHYKQE